MSNGNTEPMELDDDESKGDLTLRSLNDNTTFVLPREYVLISKVVEQALEGNSDTEVPVNISTDTLRKITEYMVQHQGTEAPMATEPIYGADMTKNVSDPWDAAFIDQIDDQGMLFDLTKAANYMDIPGLLLLCARKTASLVKYAELDDIALILSEKEREQK